MRCVMLSGAAREVLGVEREVCMCGCIKRVGGYGTEMVGSAGRCGLLEMGEMEWDGMNGNEEQEHIVMGRIEATLHCGTCEDMCTGR